jgi:NADPH-dependent glutamate synthase beta subunit-like oxidoreductase/Pyruvate/2-oxoacid:ferredoxin oxidoreductase delta subunit
MVKLTINGREAEVPAGTTILGAAREMGIYIPALCHHPDLPPAKGGAGAVAIYQGETRIENKRPGEAAEGCGLCLVEIEGESDLAAACSTKVRPGLVVATDNERIKARRQENLIPILAGHPHACLTCDQQEGCSRSHCSLNVPQNERCCTKFGRCELQAVANYVGISPRTPRWIPTALPLLDKAPLFTRDYNLCIGCSRCVRGCRDLRGVEAIGFVYDDKGQVQVGSLAPDLGESGCRFCTACVEVCPTGALMDKSVQPGRKTEDLVPCREACPAKIDIPAYLRLVAEDRRDEANAVIREKVPFPGVLGRVCIHPCEQECRRGEVNQPVSICALKRYAADGDQRLWKRMGKRAPDTGKKVAVIGAGPAGLTAAFYLRKAGHAVTVFESREKAGGMMRYGIPRHRLPEDLLDREIRDIFDLGIGFRPCHALGRGFTLEQLERDGFDAVFLAVGARLSRRIPLEGSELPDVLRGVDFLGQVAEGKPVQLKNRVIVIGGGNVAVDVALTALRCGAEKVSMVCLEKREEMPAHHREVETALAEGVRLMTSWGPQRILSRDGRVTGVVLVRCAAVLDNPSVFNPTFDATRKAVSCDQVILAVGQATDLSFLEGQADISETRGVIVVDQETMQTGREGIYAAGDVAGMAGTVIHAVAAGRKAASSIDKFLGGSGVIEEPLFQRGAPARYLGRQEGFSSLQREKAPELELHLRHKGFKEVALGYSEEQAQKEAGRCLQCDLRLFMGCNPFPPEKRIPFSEKSVEQVPGTEGVFRLYDEDQNVISIAGAANMRRDLLKILDDHEKAKWFDFEEDKMYSRRESELIQKYLHEHGRMPGAGSEEDDLF